MTERASESSTPGGVVLESIRKTYRAVVALDDVSLSVGDGELVALLGPSGSGKTSLLRTVAGLLEPDRGVVRIGGRDVTDLPTRRRSIGMVFQSYALFPNMTVAGNVAFPLTVRRRPAAQVGARVAELLDLVGLGGLGGRRPNELSGGQQQRVALARALAPEPDVLLLDEPLSALDAVIRTGLRDEIRRIQQQVGITALYVTHDQGEAMAIADRVAVMDGGRLIEVGTPAEIYDRPAQRFTALFVGGRNALELLVGADRRAVWPADGEGGMSLEVPDAANGRVLAVFRPEDVELVQHGGVVGQVHVASFQGSRAMVHVRVGAELITVDVPGRAGAALRPGDEVRLLVRPDAVRVFPG